MLVCLGKIACSPLLQNIIVKHPINQLKHDVVLGQKFLFEALFGLTYQFTHFLLGCQIWSLSDNILHASNYPSEHVRTFNQSIHDGLINAVSNGEVVNMNLVGFLNNSVNSANSLLQILWVVG